MTGPFLLWGMKAFIYLSGGAEAVEWEEISMIVIG